MQLKGVNTSLKSFSWIYFRLEYSLYSETVWQHFHNMFVLALLSKGTRWMSTAGYPSPSYFTDFAKQLSPRPAVVVVSYS